MKSRRRGFTLIELVVVLLVGITLTSITLRSFSGVQGRMAARQARSTFASLHARTRAQAIEFGQTTSLWVDFDRDSVWIQRDAVRIETLRFQSALGVDIRGTGQLRLCMNPRGFANTVCNSFSTSQTVVFAAGSDTAGVQIRPIGQLLY